MEVTSQVAPNKGESANISAPRAARENPLADLESPRNFAC